MPQVVGAVVGAIISAATYVAGIPVIGNILTSIAINAFVNFAGKALGIFKELNISSDFAGCIRNTFDGTTSHRIIYGKRRVGGQVIYQTTTNDNLDSDDEQVKGNNKFYHIILALAGHECEAIEQIWFGDLILHFVTGTKGWVDNPEYINDDNKKLIYVSYQLGTTDQVVDSFIYNNIPDHLSQYLKHLKYIQGHVWYISDGISL